MSDSQVPYFDPSEFSSEPYLKRVDKPWGYEIELVPPTAPYMLKIIHVNKGARLSLQVHDKKTESWILRHGRAAAIWEDEHGELITTELKPGVGYMNPAGRKHRLMGVTDCEVIEVSTPENGNTWRLEDDYSRAKLVPDQ